MIHLIIKFECSTYVTLILELKTFFITTIINKDNKQMLDIVLILSEVAEISNSKPKKLPENISEVQKENSVSKNNLFGILKKIIAKDIDTIANICILIAEIRLFRKIQTIKHIIAGNILLFYILKIIDI